MLEFTIFETLSGIIADTAIRFEGILYVVLLSALIIGIIGAALVGIGFAIRDIIECVRADHYGLDCLDTTTVPFLVGGPLMLFGTILLMTNMTYPLPVLLALSGLLTMFVAFMIRVTE